MVSSYEVGVTCGLTFQGLTFDALTSKLAEPALLHSAMTEHQLSHLQIYRLKIVVFQFKLSFRNRAIPIYRYALYGLVAALPTAGAAG